MLMETVGQHESQLQSLESRIATPRFEEILTEAAVQAARATTEGKIMRLSRVDVTGSVTRDQDPSSEFLNSSVMPLNSKSRTSHF